MIFSRWKTNQTPAFFLMLQCPKFVRPVPGLKPVGPVAKLASQATPVTRVPRQPTPRPISASQVDGVMARHVTNALPALIIQTMDRRHRLLAVFLAQQVSRIFVFTIRRLYHEVNYFVHSKNKCEPWLKFLSRIVFFTIYASTIYLGYSVMHVYNFIFYFFFSFLLIPSSNLLLLLNCFLLRFWLFIFVNHVIWPFGHNVMISIKCTSIPIYES